jgi:GT2 family glycosyltransferase
MKISAVIPTYNRPKQLHNTLVKILACDPPPDEILVHVDYGDSLSYQVLENFPNVKVLTSSSTSGPGGGRNKLIAASICPLIASFDDDSWPLDADFFRQAINLIESLQSDLIACSISEQGDPLKPFSTFSCLSSMFEGCGCIVRRSSFMSVRGYIPLRFAYGMEEVDLSLQFLDAGFQIHRAGQLRVFHDCNRIVHHSSPSINSAQISNTLLLAFLRYPLSLWPLALFQCGNRILFACRLGRFRGIVGGLLGACTLCWRHRNQRSPVSFSTILLFRRLRELSHNNLNPNLDV